MPYAANGHISTDPFEGGVEISEEQYAEALAGITTGKLVAIDGGFAVVDPPVEQQPEPEAPTLDQMKAAWKAYVDGDAEATRQRFITGGSGQAMTYMQKAAEASRCISDASPNPSGYPMLSAEVGITAPTLLEVAVVVNNAYTQWQVIGAAIEAIRLGAKAAIENAETIEIAIAIYEAITWPTGG